MFGGVFVFGPGMFKGKSHTEGKKRFTSEPKPVLKRSLLGQIAEKVVSFLLNKIFDFRRESTVDDLHYRLSITPHEASRGTDKRIALKRASKTEKLLVRIPPGIRSGTNLRLKGKGNPSPYGGQPGDLYIKIKIMDHPTFNRLNNDLYSKHEISQEQLEPYLRHICKAKWQT